MNGKRIVTALAVTMTLLIATTPGVSADEEENLKTEWLTYAGTNTDIPTLFFGSIHVGIFEPCDESGIGGVRFCETLDNETLPDRIYINVRDDLGPRVGFYWAFSNETSGDTLRSGFACGEINEIVPHTGHGPEGDPFFDQNATQLVVRPNLITSALLCGSPTILTGTTTVVWRYNAPAFDP